MTSPFRVKAYAHRDYKFVVRAKIDGRWKRRYFRTEQEAVTFAAEQNRSFAHASAGRGVIGSTRPAADITLGSGKAADLSPRTDEDLTWTGERVLPSSPRPVAYEHLHRYAIACDLAREKRVLDIACGEGYGANLLADFAADVVAVDIDAETVAHAAEHYRRTNLRFVEGDCLAIPLPDESIDLVVSFETIEHLREHDQFLAELRRVLAPGGTLVISSPDRDEYARVSAQPNPFHVAELAEDEFANLLRRSFKNVITGRQRLVLGSWIAPDHTSEQVTCSTAEGWFDRVTIEEGVTRGVYSIAVCSDAPLPQISFGIFENFHETTETWDLLDQHGTAAEIAMHLASSAAKPAPPGDRLDGRSLRLFALKQKHRLQAEELRMLRQQAADKSGELVELRTNSHALMAQLAAARERLHAAEAQLQQTSHESDELIEARWESLTLRGDVLREKEKAADAVSELAETEDRANAATAERNQLRPMILSMQHDLEQERLNVLALDHRCRLAEQRADAYQADIPATANSDDPDATEQSRAVEERLYAAEDRASVAEAALSAAERRAAASEDQLRTIRAQWEATQEQLRITGKDLAARRTQILQLRKKLGRRLILPFGKMQQRIDELTR